MKGAQRRVWGFVCGLLGLTLGVWAESVPTPTVSEAVKSEFEEGTRLVGGRIASALVAACERIDDELVGSATGSAAWVEIRRSISGLIGPVEVHHPKLKGVARASARQSAFGETWTGDANHGPQVKPPKGIYRAAVSPTFAAGYAKWNASARKRYYPACVELAAGHFLGADAASACAITDEKMYAYWRVAAAYGEQDARYLAAVCLYYGLGVKADRAKAVEELTAWRKKREPRLPAWGWTLRRLSAPAPAP